MEENKETGAPPAKEPAAIAQRESNHATIGRGISLAANQVRAAIRQAVARNQIDEEDGEEIFWLYSYAQTYGLKEGDLAPKVGFDKNTLYQMFRGIYGAASWRKITKAIRDFKRVEIEEMRKKHIGILETQVKRTVFAACTAALNDGMPAFIYGASQIGKTCALEEFQRLNNHGRTVYLRMGSGWTRPRLVRELAVKFGNGVKASKSWVLEDAIFGSLTRYNLLIIDEFHLALETATENSAKAIMEFIREIYDRTGCGLVLSATKVGLAGIEQGKNRMLFDQLRRRGVVRIVLPDVPPVRDLNLVAKSFDLEPPRGELLSSVKTLVKGRGFGVFLKYLQKAYSLAKKRGEDLTWDGFSRVMDGYLALGAMEGEY